MTSTAIPASSWNPAQYQKYQAQRLRPALELLARVPLQTPQTVFDLGCGTGEVTALMAERWPAALITGIDNSPQMLPRARHSTERLVWQQGDIRHWQPPQNADLIYSNAALQWLDDHDRLFPRLINNLTTGGCLAVQMPLSWDAPSHVLMRETLTTGDTGKPWGSAGLRDRLAHKWVATADWYYDLLAPLSAQLDIWTTEYQQALTGDDPVFEWVKATALRPVLDELDEVDTAKFSAAYKARLREAYPRREDGVTLYPFKRLFMVALRAGNSD